MKEAQRAMKKAEGMFNSIKKMIEETTDEEVIAELMGDHDRLWSELEDARAAFNTADLAFKTVAKQKMEREQGKEAKKMEAEKEAKDQGVRDKATEMKKMLKEITNAIEGLKSRLVYIDRLEPEEVADIQKRLPELEATKLVMLEEEKKLDAAVVALDSKKKEDEEKQKMKKFAGAKDKANQASGAIEDIKKQKQYHQDIINDSGKTQ